MSHQDDVDRLIRHLESAAGLIRRTLTIAEDFKPEAAPTTPTEADVQGPVTRAGVSEPAAPAVDDDLVINVIREAVVAVNGRYNWDDLNKLDAGRRLLASEPMQRYVNIKERQATAKYVEDALRIRDERDAAGREPQPSDGPDYHEEHAAWLIRSRRGGGS